jgi:hypothetical protein
LFGVAESIQARSLITFRALTNLGGLALKKVPLNREFPVDLVMLFDPPPSWFT